MKKTLHILLADDDKDDRFFFKKALKQLSIPTRLTTVGDGEELLNFLTNPAKELPDMLFLDLNMPRKNGSECLLKIKSDEKLKHMPVIIHSTSLHEEVADILYKNGAHYYLKKCGITELPKALNRIMNALAKDPAQPPRSRFVMNLQEV